MEAKIKCSHCGAEITNLNLSWGKRQWLWGLVMMIVFIPLAYFLPYLMFGRHKGEFVKDLQATVQESQLGEDSIMVLGKVTNSGSVEWDGVTLEVELFDAQNRFLGEASQYLSGSLQPGAEENVSIAVPKPSSDVNQLPPRVVLKVTGARVNPF